MYIGFFSNAVINNSSYLKLALREWELKHVACVVRAATGHLEKQVSSQTEELLFNAGRIQ